MIPWVLSASDSTVGDVMVVVGMLAVEIFLLVKLLPRNGPAVPLTRMILGSSLLLGSSTLLMSIVAAALTPNLTSYTVVLAAFNGMMMVPIGIWICVLVVLQDRRIDARGWWWPSVIAVMATAAEVLMGVVFVVADGTTPLTVPAVAAASLLSAWFLWSMAAAMIALLVWVRLTPGVRTPLLGLAASAIVAPWVAVDPLFGLLLMGAVMALTLLAIARTFGLRRVVTAPRDLGIAAAVVGAFLAMMTASSAVALDPTSVAAQLALGIVLLLTMLGEFLLLVREGLRPSMLRPTPDPEPTSAPVAAAATPLAPP